MGGTRSRWRKLMVGAVVTALAAQGAVVLTTPSAAAAQAAPPVLQPYDRLLQGLSAPGWTTLEAEARAAVAAVHDVPNDLRLVRWARNEIRAYMFARLLEAIDRQHNGQTLTANEQVWLEQLSNLVQARRIARAETALAEFQRFGRNPCGYQPPEGFGFSRIPTHASCVTPFYTGLPQAPPSAEQFQAYATAIEDGDILTAPDAEAAFKGAMTYTAFFGGLVAAGLISAVAVAAIQAAGVSLAVATALGSKFAFLTVPGALYGTVTVGTTAGLAAGLVVTVVTVVIVAAVITAIALWQLIEAELVDDRLEAALADAEATPDLWAISQGDGKGDILAALLQATLTPTGGDYSADRAAADTPDARRAFDPEFFEPRSTTSTPILATKDWDGRPQESYIVGNWFVTRQAGKDWEWDLGLDYLDGLGLRQSAYVRGQQFLVQRALVPGDTALAPAVETRTLIVSDPAFVSLAIPRSWTVRHFSPPLVRPTATSPVAQAEPITLRANTSDPDRDSMSTEWIVQPDRSGTFIESSPNDCGGTAIPTNCNWPSYTGDDVTLTYRGPGTYLARAITTDSRGQVSSATVEFTVTNVAPTFPTGPTLTMNGRTATVTGSVDDPGTFVRVGVDWGDGTTSTQNFPCTILDPGCSSDINATFDGPATFTFTYTFDEAPPEGATFDVVVSAFDGTTTTTADALPVTFGSRPVAEPRVSGDLVEGSVLTFDVERLHGDPSVPVVGVQWIFEPEKPTGSLGVTDPVNDALCRVPTGPAAGCTWPRVDLITAQRTYRVEGDYLARLIVTDANGQVATATLPFTIGNAAPAFTAGPRAAVLGQQVTLTGGFADPGQDEVLVRVDWGDGTITQRRFACDPTVSICLGFSPANRPTDFSFSHTYASFVPAGFPRVSLTDDDVTVGPQSAEIVTPPSVPLGLVATQTGSARVSVAFQVPASTGGSPITSYRTVCTSSTGGAARSTTGLANPVVLTGFTLGATYTCRTSATNGIGTGATSAPTAPFVVGAVPSAPPAVAAEISGNLRLRVTFTPPADTGSSPILSYRAVCTGTFSGSRSASGPASPLVVTGLAAGDAYTCVVAATNSAGTGPASAPSASRGAITIPGPPTDVVVTSPAAVSTPRLSVSFQRPLPDFAIGVPTYRALCTSPTGVARSASGTGSPLVVSGLTGGAQYSCVVTASNPAGTSRPSTPSNVVQPLGRPDAPTNLTVTPAGPGVVHVSATAPASDGGSPITSYRAVCTSSGTGIARSASNTTGPIVVTQLTVGQSYTCRMSASNVFGPSTASAPSAAFVAR